MIKLNILTVILTVTSAAMPIPVAQSVLLTGFAGPSCTGAQGPSFDVGLGVCFPLSGAFTTSVKYTDVVSNIEFFVASSNCTNGPTVFLGGGDGCATAPAGFEWKGVVIT